MKKLKIRGIHPNYSTVHKEKTVHITLTRQSQRMIIVATLLASELPKQQKGKQHLRLVDVCNLIFGFIGFFFSYEKFDFIYFFCGK